MIHDNHLGKNKNCATKIELKPVSWFQFVVAKDAAAALRAARGDRMFAGPASFSLTDADGATTTVDPGTVSAAFIPLLTQVQTEPVPLSNDDDIRKRFAVSPLILCTNPFELCGFDCLMGRAHEHRHHCRHCARGTRCSLLRRPLRRPHLQVRPRLIFILNMLLMFWCSHSPSGLALLIVPLMAPGML
jgi:hypothetical protein